MTQAPRPALAALEAGIAHVGRHHRLPFPYGTEQWLALRVTRNVRRELDTLLGHAIAEARGIDPDRARPRLATAQRRTLARQRPGAGELDGLAAGYARVAAGLARVESGGSRPAPRATRGDDAGVAHR